MATWTSSCGSFNATSRVGGPDLDIDEKQARLDDTDRATFDALKRGFLTPFLDAKHAVEELVETVTTCWRESHKLAKRQFPLVAVVQSAGYGKSRLVYEFAKRVNPTIRVLYVNLRAPQMLVSTAVPAATPFLHHYLFPIPTPFLENESERLTKRLCRLFVFAWANWITVDKLWLDLFTDDAADRAVCTALKDFKAQKMSIVKCSEWDERRVLVLALDEAHRLVAETTNDSWIVTLRLALKMANTWIQQRFGTFAGILVLAVSADPAIVHFGLRPSRHFLDTMETRANLCAPLVLIHTVDVVFDNWVRQQSDVMSYQALVLSASFESLMLMGRPLWTLYAGTLGVDHAIERAAEMLVGDDAAAMFCSLGLRPLPWSPLAAGVVANSGATLSYVSPRCNQFVSAYIAEPIVAFGAARIWYRATSSSGNAYLSLEQRLLPRLRTLVREEVIDTGDRGVVVVRIILLLAIDTVGVLVDGVETSRPYKGSFDKVSDFLRVLACELRDTNGDLLWQDWNVGSGSFVELTHKPTKDVLWAMLSRRVAGVLPPQMSGYSVVIPIFLARPEPCVSMILAQVDSRPAPAPNVLRLKHAVFDGGTDDAVMRMYVGFSESQSPSRPYFIDQDNNNQPALLWIQGLAAWTATVANSNTPFISKGVMDELETLLIS